MEFIKCGKRLESKIRSKKIHSYKGMIYKYSPECKSLLMDLECKKGKIHSDYFRLAEQLLLDKECDCFGFAVKDLKDYKTLDCIPFDSIDRKKILYNIRLAINSLKKIGYTYYDINSKNILLKDSKIKLDNMDEIKGVNLDEYQKKEAYNYMDLMLNLYFSLPFFEEKSIIETMLHDIDFKAYYSNTFVEYLEYVENMQNNTSTIDTTPFVHELEDEEKRKAFIRNEILCKQLN